MRLDNVPVCVGFTVAGVVTLLSDFQAAMLAGIVAYVLSFAALAMFVAQLPEYDHATPVPGSLSFLALTSTVAMLYLFLRLWLWTPEQLPWLRDPSWVGALVTLGCLWMAPSVIQPIVVLTR